MRYTQRMEKSTIILKHCQLYTADTENQIITDGAVVIEDNQIAWIGDSDNLPAGYTASAHRLIEPPEGWITPGFIDCHTHLVYGGNRADEFKRQLAGESYKQIAESGGGIASTVRSTRQASEDELFQLANKRIASWINQGVTHLEIKSGYGLTLESELKMLNVAKRLEQANPVGVSKTLLAAHALPPEYQETNPDDIAKAHDDYIEYICNHILPVAIASNLVDAVDGFCENIAFSSEQIETLFQKAKELSIPLKLHAEQLSNQQGSLMAARLGALSVDHLEYLDEESIRKMSSSGTVAVLLPAAFYFLKETKLPPIDLLRQYDIPIAIATDHNPGSAPVTSLPLMLNMACRLFGLLPAEALLGVTLNAAKALGIEHSKGSLAVGKQADLVCWPVETLEDLSYYFGDHKPEWIMQNGQFTLGSPMARV